MRLFTGRVRPNLTAALGCVALIGCARAGNDSTAILCSNPPAAPPALTVVSPLPDAVANVSFNTVLSVSGGTAPYVWSVVSGSLPAGLSLGPSSGAITGTPIVGPAANFTLQVTDSAGSVTTNAFTLSVHLPTLFVQDQTGTMPSAASTLSVSMPNATGGGAAGAFLIAAATWESATIGCGSPCIADTQGNVWTCLATLTAPNGWNATLCYAPVTGAGGADSVTFNAAAIAPALEVNFYEYQGIKAVAGTCALAGAGGNATCSLSTTAANALVFGQEYDETAATGPGAGFVARSNANGDIAEDAVLSGNGNYQVVVDTLDTWVIFGLALAI